MLNPTLQKFRLGVLSPDPHSARSLSRVFGPLNAMRRQDPRLELVKPDPGPDGQINLDWDYFGGLDAVYLLDPYRPQEIAYATLARACGCKVWVDYIDDLFHVPASNPSYAAYAEPDKLRPIIGDLRARADVITTTTAALQDVLLANTREGNLPLILPESCRWAQCPFPRERVVTWRGSPTHAEDIESVLPELAAVANLPQFSLWKWVFIGFEKPDWRIARMFQNAKEQLTWVPWLPPYDFMNTWGGFAPYLHIAPLVDTPFNRSKTSLGWLEATAIGAAVIGPGYLPEWQDCPGLIPYTTPAEFGEALKRELFTYQPVKDGNGGNFHPHVAMSRAAVYPARTLQAVNEKRWWILNQLAAK